MSTVSARWLSKPEAAAYLGVSLNYFNDSGLASKFTWVNVAPPHRRELLRADRLDLDAYMDALKAAS